MEKRKWGSLWGRMMEPRAGLGSFLGSSLPSLLCSTSTPIAVAFFPGGKGTGWGEKSFRLLPHPIPPHSQVSQYRILVQ